MHLTKSSKQQNTIEGQNSTTNMNGGGRRQLPSWMLKPCTVKQASVSGVIEENNINDSETHSSTITSLTQNEITGKKPKSGVSFAEQKSRKPKKREVISRDRTSGDENEEQLDEPSIIKPCRTRKSKRRYERAKDQDCDLPQSYLETDDASMRKKCRVNTLEKKKTNKSVEGSSDGMIPSEDELTVDDLVSIAKEYVNADIKEPENPQFKSEMRSSIAEVDPGKGVTANKELETSHCYKPLPVDSTSTGPLSGCGSIIGPIDTFDPAREMLELLFGDLLKKPELERKDDATTEHMMLDYEVCKRSQNDVIAAEAVPVLKKKARLKDKVAMLLE